ncbi:hypothetical protein HU200_012217 [Digitaria exilis]|uniref:Bifunctional inhibitor/plant lipid transfer protein/seed storage helical domain-containing protein n=1 Tax=Digitaria exilis TaxID=1010633 RepID=A0A835FFX4_9POAL|nr:hypothetical protein HU200_012217 [Digitaria exilis]
MTKLISLFSIIALIVTMSIAGIQAEECGNDLQDLARECKQYVMNPPNPKTPPSKACCDVVKKVNIPCMCSKVTKETEHMVCMEKVVYVAHECKRPFAHGYKCGSKCFMLILFK